MQTTRLESLTGTLDYPFTEYDDPPADPFVVFACWLGRAKEHDVREPRALSLATADADGRASNRTVVLNEVTDRGVVFVTHASSRKGRDLTATQWASGLLYWRELGQQVILTGPVERLPEAESERLWFARPVGTHPVTSVSRQSQPLDDIEALRTRAERFTAVGGPLPRPDDFVGFHLTPATVEFWSACADRLHKRLQYVRTGTTWTPRRLQP